ncbi:MAG: RHS repeat-associated core domain-containing protein, partial [Prevotellaceae bacterium]|nr:RHS repeat-associated core domain-containing protein [Prevotellaceae bacterium]
HYFGNIEYGYSDLHQRQDPKLLRIHNAEGYYSDNQYYYFRRDHLGNNREVWRVADNKTVQITHYYPSGMPWATTQEQNPDLQPYKYNGKEFVEDYGYDAYDYGFRGYYAAIGRFTSIDPMAEKYYGISPYAYCANNPIRYIDIKGKAIYIINPNSTVNVGIETMRQTQSGQALWDKYANSTTVDVYISAQEFPEGATGVAATIQDLRGRKEISKNKINIDTNHAPNFSAANGTDVSQSKGRKIFAISVDTKTASKQDKYYNAETIYHELDAHVDIYEANEGTTNGDEEHSIYGVDYDENNNETIKAGSDADIIRQELYQLQNSGY